MWHCCLKGLSRISSVSESFVDGFVLVLTNLLDRAGSVLASIEKIIFDEPIPITSAKRLLRI